MEGDLACDGGRISSLAPQISREGQEEIDAQGKLLMPGVIDPQVHFREPGGTDKEDLGSGARAAVRGGVTSFLEMPNCHPARGQYHHYDQPMRRLHRAELNNNHLLLH